MSELAWIPHPTEVWAVARAMGADVYKLEDPLDEATAEAAGTTITLTETNLKQLVQKMKGISGMSVCVCLYVGYCIEKLPISLVN